MTGFMTMLTTMIWEIQTRVQIMPVKLLEGLVSILILEEEELAVLQLSQVSHFVNLVVIILELLFTR